MKKFFIGVWLLLLIGFIPKVYAVGLGTPTSSENYDGIMDIGQNQEYTIASGGKHAVVVTYNSYEDVNISMITVAFTLPSGFRVNKSDSQIGNNVSLTGSDLHYDINFTENTEYYGAAIFILNIPSVQEYSKQTVRTTIAVYDSTGAIIDTKSISIEYHIVPKLNNYENNYNVSVTTNAGQPELVGELLGKNYTLTTNNDKINITITPESSKTKINYYGHSISSNGTQPLSNGTLNDQSLNYGENDFYFEVATECSSKSNEVREKTSGISIIGGFDWYNEAFCNSDLVTLSVTRNDNRSKVNTLKTLSISDVTLNFKSDLKTYMATVPYKVSSVKINSTLTDSKSSYVKGFGNRTVELKEGTNDVLVKVKAENGAESTYTIKITREKNDDATLKSLTLNDKEIKIEEKILKYTEYVNNEVTTANIVAKPNDDNAKVEIDKISELKEGINTVNITVTSSSGKKNIYVLSIVRDKLISENSKLKNITIKNHDFKFNSNTHDYTLEIDKNEDSLDIEVETEHPKANYLIIGNKNLKNGSLIKIKVTAEDGKTVTNYNIAIMKQSSNLKLILFIAIPIIIIAIVVFAIINKNKHNNKPKYQSLEEKETDADANLDELPINNNTYSLSNNNVPNNHISNEVNNSIPNQPNNITPNETIDNNHSQNNDGNFFG